MTTLSADRLINIKMMNEYFAPFWMQFRGRSWRSSRCSSTPSSDKRALEELTNRASYRPGKVDTGTLCASLRAVNFHTDSHNKWSFYSLLNADGKMRDIRTSSHKHKLHFCLENLNW